MNLKSKFLGGSAWKDLASKNKIKDNGLAKALERLERAGDDDHDEQSRSLQEAIKLAAQLKKDKAVAAAAAVARYLGEVQSDAEALLREVAKARAEHEKAQKAKAEAEKKAAAKKQDDDDDDEEEESPELLTSKLKPLLKLVAKGESMHALLAKSGKQVVVMLSRKPIPPARRKMLADQLGGGSTKYYPGTCSLEAGATTFALKAEVAGMSKLVKAAVLQQTGLRMNKIKCRGEDGDDEDADDTPGDAPEDAKAGPAKKTREEALAEAEGLAASIGGGPATPAKPDPWSKAAEGAPDKPGMWTDDLGGNLPMSDGPAKGGFIPHTGPLGGTWTTGGGDSAKPKNISKAPADADPKGKGGGKGNGGVEVVQDPRYTWDPTEVPEDSPPPPAWTPQSPDVENPGEPTAWAIGANSVVSIPLKVKINKDFGPVTVDSLVLNLEGKVSTPTGKEANAGAGAVGKGPGAKFDIPIASWKELTGPDSDWKASLKGAVDVAGSSTLGCKLEFTNGLGIIEVSVTFVGLDKEGVQPPSVKITGGFTVKDKPFIVQGATMYFSGKVTAGVALKPNWKWIGEKIGRTVAPAAGAGSGVITTGVAAVGGAQLVIAGGFLAVAAGQAYAFYRGMLDIQSLKRLQKDADQAVKDFCSGFTAAWTGTGGGNGDWGKLGASTGAGQLNADLKDFIAYQEGKPENKGKTMDQATKDEVVKMWRQKAAENSGAFNAIVEAMFAKMIRTGVYLQWRKSNDGHLLLDQLSADALNFCGLPGGPVTTADIQAGRAAAKNANMQINIDNWSKL